MGDLVGSRGVILGSRSKTSHWTLGPHMGACPALDAVAALRRQMLAYMYMCVCVGLRARLCPALQMTLPAPRGRRAGVLDALATVPPPTRQRCSCRHQPPLHARMRPSCLCLPGAHASLAAERRPGSRRAPLPSAWHSPCAHLRMCHRRLRTHARVCASHVRCFVLCISRSSPPFSVRVSVCTDMGWHCRLPRP